MTEISLVLFICSALIVFMCSLCMALRRIWQLSDMLTKERREYCELQDELRCYKRKHGDEGPPLFLIRGGDDE